VVTVRPPPHGEGEKAGGGRRSTPLTGMEARAQERAKRRAELQERYAAEEAAAAEAARLAQEREERRGEEEKAAQRAAAVARRKQAKREAEGRAALIRLAEWQVNLAVMHYRLSLQRHHGWQPWLAAVGEARMERWRAADIHRRRLLGTVVEAWWSIAEEAMAWQWQKAAAAQAHWQRALQRQALLALHQWVAAGAHRRQRLIRISLSSLWRLVELQQAMVELAACFRWEELCSLHFSAWKSVWRVAADTRLLAEATCEAQAWEHACSATRQRSFRVWMAAVAAGRAERQRMERKAELWGRVNIWLVMPQGAGEDEDQQKGEAVTQCPPAEKRSPTAASPSQPVSVRDRAERTHPKGGCRLEEQQRVLQPGLAAQDEADEEVDGGGPWGSALLRRRAALLQQAAVLTTLASCDPRHPSAFPSLNRSGGRTAARRPEPLAPPTIFGRMSRQEFVAKLMSSPVAGSGGGQREGPSRASPHAREFLAMLPPPPPLTNSWRGKEAGGGSSPFPSRAFGALSSLTAWSLAMDRR